MRYDSDIVLRTRLICPWPESVAPWNKGIVEFHFLLYAGSPSGCSANSISNCQLQYLHVHVHSAIFCHAPRTQSTLWTGTHTHTHRHKWSFIVAPFLVSSCLLRCFDAALAAPSGMAWEVEFLLIPSCSAMPGDIHPCWEWVEIGKILVQISSK